MCSIFCILDIRADAARLRETALAMSKLLRHRGPDWSGIYASDRAVLAHERLAIVDVNHGAQPLLNPSGTHVLAVNGEIYNHRSLKEGLQRPFAFATESDCEVILALYADKGPAFLDDLNGIFAFVLYDAERDAYLIGRDHLGIVPLYWGKDAEGRRYVASEVKALVPVCTEIEEFPPGSYYFSEDAAPTRYYQRAWMDFDAVKDAVTDRVALRTGLEDAVRRQLMCDVPYGVLLSGGLDSSIISALATKLAARRVEDDERSPAWWPRIHSFAIGLEGSPDLAAAKVVADHLGTVHHGFTYTVQEGLDAVRDVIHHVETYDVTTIRASTPMYLMARKIRAMGIKMVLSGEGADEVFAGYLYFHKAPSAQALHEESVRKVLALHQFDCARANKSMAAWGVEARVPFLDKVFLDVAMGLNPTDKLCGGGKMEKQLLRECFGHELPAQVAWRQKEQFSDGVGYGWIDSLKALAADKVSPAELAGAAERFAYNPPTTREGYLFRSIFDELFPHPDAARCVPGGPSVACSSPAAILWDQSFQGLLDPSGRAVRGVHKSSY